MFCKLVIWGVVMASAVGGPLVMGRQTERDGDPARDVPAEWLQSFSWRGIGPALMSGRIADIAIDSTDPSIWYVAVGSGGVFKTDNAGTTWEPIFDHYGSYSIGCVTLDPSRSATVWVGTGENVGGRHVGYGDGVYVSHNGGKTFEHRGLKETGHISKILIDPRDSNVVWVAAQGPLWSAGGERGLYKSTDGGQTWRQVLAGGPYTGVTDVVMDPVHSDVLYAARHQRQRTVWALLNTGPESGIFKSTDGGETWRELKVGLPGDHKGKIGLGVSARDSAIVYATIELPNRTGGFYRSSDHGESWVRMSDFVSGGTGPHYYQEIYVDPHRFDVIYHANPALMRSVDGGRNWDNVEGRWKHVDNHAIVFHPRNKDFVLAGTDGGVYRSNDFARTWTFFGNLPITQFYKIDVDYDEPFYHVIGGTQDNSTQYGPVRTNNIHGIRNSDWIVPIGGDGHDNALDPVDPNIIYCESQQGYIRRVDRSTGVSIDIRPRPGKGEEDFRFNWDAPILISPHAHTRIYFGSNYLHRSDDRGDSWTTVSPDLSRGVDRWTLPMMGRVWGMDAGFDLMAMSRYGNITSISESPIVEGLLYVGTDDGLIQVSEDGGQNWRKIDKIYGLPEFAFCNDVKADRHDADTVYACFDHHKYGDYRPYVVRSRDRGRTWDSIVGDLPERHLVWRLEQDHVEPRLLFLGTEYGVFVSFNAGETWIKLRQGMPAIPVRDLAIQRRENDLLAGTFGRGIYVLDDYAALRQLVRREFAEREVHLFEVRPTPWYRQVDHFGFNAEKGFQGDDYFTAPNPPFGAALTVFVRDSHSTLRELRQAREAAALQDNRDAEIASWDALRAEADEEPTRLMIEITDAAGQLVNRVECPRNKGIHRVYWDLRRQYPGDSGFQPMVPPGTYRAQVIRLAGNTVVPVGDSVEFVLRSIVTSTLASVDEDQLVSLQQRVAEIQRQLRLTQRRLSRLMEELSEAKRQLIAASPQPGPLYEQARAMELAIGHMQERLGGDTLKSSRAVDIVPGIAARAGGVARELANNPYAATTTQQQQIAIAAEALEELQAELELMFREQFVPWRDAVRQHGIGLDD